MRSILLVFYLTLLLAQSTKGQELPDSLVNKVEQAIDANERYRAYSAQVQFYGMSNQIPRGIALGRKVIQEADSVESSLGFAMLLSNVGIS